MHKSQLYVPSPNLEKEKPPPRSTGELKIGELEFASFDDPNTNFQLEACKLVQANAILTELIKESIIEKYSLSEKIHNVLEQIKKLENKNNAK